MVRDGAMRLLTMRVWHSPANSDLILRSGREAASRRMATTRTCIPATAIRPGSASLATLEAGGRRECRALAASMARLQQKTQAAVTTGRPGNPAFPARWFYGLYALSSECRA